MKTLKLLGKVGYVLSAVAGVAFGTYGACIVILTSKTLAAVAVAVCVVWFASLAIRSKVTQ